MQMKILKHDFQCYPTNSELASSSELTVDHSVRKVGRIVVKFVNNL